MNPAPREFGASTVTRRSVAWLAIAAGTVVLAGWAFDVAALKPLLGGAIPMKANAAVALMLAGAALGLTGHRGGRIAAAGVLVIGAATVLEYAVGWDLHIDQLLFNDLSSPFRAPGRMAVTTAIAFLVLGGALILASSGRPHARRLAEALFGAVALFALFEIEGYLVGTAGLAGYTKMALLTALLLAALAATAIVTMGDGWLVGRAAAAGASGPVVRRLLPLSIALSLGLGKVAQGLGWRDAENIAVVVIIGMTLMIAGVLWSGVTLEGAERSRAAAEAALRDGERQLAAAQAIAHVGSWEWHIASGRVTWSHELYRMYGVPPETAASYEAFQALVHPDDRDRVAQIIARGVVDRVTVDYEWRLVRPDGVVRHMLGRNVTLVDGRGVAVGLAGTTLDVTEQKRAEEALAQSEAYHRALIEQALDIITIVDGDLVMRYLSPSVERILGYRPDELVGRRAFEFLHPDDLEMTLTVFSEGISTPGAMRRLEYRFQHKDGSWRYLEGVGRNLLEDPLIKAVVVNARDVSERKATEENQRTLLGALQTALAEVKTLRGLIKICATCKRVLTDEGGWEQFESYVRGHSDVEFSHGICPECAAKWSADLA